MSRCYASPNVRFDLNAFSVEVTIPRFKNMINRVQLYNFY